jgi:molybdenum cofactor cytidylyltransferase
MNTKNSRCYAIIPAAGHSRRMGESKLLLPWRDGQIIDAVLRAWTTSQVTQVVVVMRRDDQPLRTACDRWPVSVVTADQDPPDMKASIQIGLRHLGDIAQSADRCFIAPADLPTLTAEIIDALIDAAIAATESGKIVVPRFGQRAGHPALLPWSLTSQIFGLAENEGVNRIVDQHEKLYVPFSAEKLVTDVDTPEQYQQLLRKTGTK